jgi:DNA-binding MarR family transcriptional regulator
VKRNAEAAGAPLLVLPCACANLRRAARAISQVYDDELRPAGLTLAQFTLLQFLSLAGPVTQSVLARELVLDETTLTRTLRTLERRKWIRRDAGSDRRSRVVALTRDGRSLFRRALPGWNRAQARLRGRIGRRRWSGLLSELARIAGPSRRA